MFLFSTWEIVTIWADDQLPDGGTPLWVGTIELWRLSVHNGPPTTTPCAAGMDEGHGPPGGEVWLAAPAAAVTLRLAGAGANTASSADPFWVSTTTSLRP